VYNIKKNIVMAKSKELIGLIAGFSAGTFLGAMFMRWGNSSTQRLKDKEREKDKESVEVVV
jgi:uncharacterized membrane-anchored protein YhcB (DUF1043 family)